MNKSFLEELDKFCENEDLSFLRDKSILITGASGLIGSYLVDVIMHSNKIQTNSTRVYAVVRNVKKAKERFSEYIDNNFFHLVKQDVSETLDFDFNVDYIVHAASNANPAAFNSDPLGTIKANVNGTFQLMEYAKVSGIKKFLYVSSSEVYGEPVSPGTIYDESSMGTVDPMNPRSCYTESKRMSENICVNYNKQYGIPCSIARVCFAYGSTFSDSDNRVIPQFVRNAIENKDIVLKSTGSLIRSYAYLYDVASGLLKILSEGKSSEVYNIANRDSNVSIREIAETIAEIAQVKTIYDLPENEKDKGYAPFSVALLDATKLEKLGWRPLFNIKKGLSKTLAILTVIFNKTFNLIVSIYVN